VSPASKCAKPFLSVGRTASTSLLRAISRTSTAARGDALASEWMNTSMPSCAL
jgi:hypothetical protein